MRFVFFILITIVSFLSEGFGEEKPFNEFIIRIAPEQLELRENGMFLSTNAFSEVSLDNLHFDREGYFTTFQFAFICTDCQKQFDIHPLICYKCESIKFELISLNRNEDGSLYALQSMFLSILNNFSIYNEGMLCYKGSVSVGGNTDTDGNKAVDVKIQGESENGSFSWEGSGTIEKDPEGNTNGKAEARVIWNFNS